MSETAGHFRLIKKIDEDVLGTVHCAAWQAEESPEEIVLVRLFDRAGLDPDLFLERAAARQALVGTEISDQLMTSRRLGVTEGQAFDVLPYASGKSLASLIRQAVEHRVTFPLEVALFIVGRVAAGLGTVYQQQIDGVNLTHGFVTPHLVRVSEEGQVRLCGLEAAPALRDFRGTAQTFAEILPYLSPESTSGEDLHPSDDVYSLGVMLYELLTLKPLASPADLRIESRNISSELRYFLDRTVAPRFRRIQSVRQWIQELKTLVIEEEWVASAKDLSAFIAGIDERLHPLKPDTSEITASDRQALAEAIRRARPQNAEPTTDEPTVSPAETASEAASDESPAGGETMAENRTSYQTMVIGKDILKPLVDEGKLVEPSPVERSAESLSEASPT